MSDVRLATTVGGLTLPNPVMTAAGCAGFGRELAQFVDLAQLGALVTRSVTLDPDPGAPMPRIVPTPSGLLGGAGTSSPGITTFLATELPWLVQQRTRAVVSIAGHRLGEYAELARRLGASPGVAAVEVNLACTNADGSGRDFAADPYLAAKVVTAVRGELPRDVPVLAKLSADVHSIVDAAQAVASAGADAVVLIAGLSALRIDVDTMRPALGSGLGWLSGPAILPVALRCVWQVHAASPQLPVVAAGGVRTGRDALECLLAGASAVQVGTALLSDPTAAHRVLTELGDELTQRQVPAVSAIVGLSHSAPADGSSGSAVDLDGSAPMRGAPR